MKAPAFQLYAADFYMDTAGWTAAEVGAYFRLLMHEWVNGPLPADNSSRARIAGVDVRNMQKMWSAVIAKKFTADIAGMYVNSRLESTREEQQEYSKNQRDRGIKGAEKRWKKPIANAITEAQPENDSSSSSSTLKIKEYTPEFIQFYETYPRKSEKFYTFKCWQKLNGKRPSIEVLLLAIENQKKWREHAAGEFRPEWKNPATWLNKGCWDDDVGTQKAVQKKRMLRPSDVPDADQEWGEICKRREAEGVKVKP